MKRQHEDLDIENFLDMYIDDDMDIKWSVANSGKCGNWSPKKFKNQ